ncbi:hypothetical protein HBH98_166220 [Parastagonospora nodorum]|nr:hypothetical protein HBH54_097930 [Parastagonospora nodorum]KAH3944334.1 hypothetical protein HBH53_159410 [Parastagonospora nodorum]KAH4014202.1 hypothetical protein HBI13_170940 [Parastagonospora nodorum]KAH4052389.1 hypothetical protein HBH49_100680 [Parastagonospora nodorum]KAH4070775.1 hypothetical protein HBH50_088820 [Parastagonospora nodorum]
MGDVVMSATPVRPRPHGAVHSAGSRQIGPHPSHPCQALALVRPRALQPDAGGDADADADVEAEAEAAAATKIERRPQIGGIASESKYPGRPRDLAPKLA